MFLQHEQPYLIQCGRWCRVPKPMSQQHMHLFCRHGFAARYLIEQGADPFVQDKTFHRSAIHYAAARGKIDVLRRLMDDNLQIHTEEGFVPLKAARIQDVSGHCRYCQVGANCQFQACHNCGAMPTSVHCSHISRLPIDLIFVLELVAHRPRSKLSASSSCVCSLPGLRAAVIVPWLQACYLSYCSNLQGLKIGQSGIQFEYRARHSV